MIGTETAKRSAARIAEGSRSAGRSDSGGTGRRQASSAHSRARKQRAFNENVAAGPAAAIAKPPSAGPSARAMLKPTPLSAIAWTTSSSGTSSGVAAAQPGNMTAVPAPTMKVSANKSQAPSRPSAASAASSSPAAAIQIWAAMSMSRRSRMSASAPPGSANRKTGSMLAACTKLTITGEGASEVMSHPAPVFWTQSRYCWPVLRSRARGKPGGGAGQRGCGWNSRHGPKIRLRSARNGPCRSL